MTDEAASVSGGGVVVAFMPLLDDLIGGLFNYPDQQEKPWPNARTRG